METTESQDWMAQQLRLRNAALELESRRAKEASHAKVAFLASMSHELRTPLNAIIGFAELLLEKSATPKPEHQQFLQEILASGRHLLGIINDILDFAKTEAGKLSLHPSSTDLRELIAEVSAVLSGTAAEKAITVRAEVDDSLGSVFLDPVRLKQVLYNYLSNALKFTETGTVTIRARAEGADLFRLEVEDTGIGIAPDDVGHLFEEFRQVEPPLQRKYPGTGLGLALTKRLVEAQDGWVGVRSQPGNGSVFYAVLPRRARNESRPAPPPPSRRAEAGRPTVLVIEDEPQDQEAMSTLLDQLGFEVEVAGSGAAALALLKHNTFAAITLDLLLPDSSGPKLLSAIRSDPRHRDVPILVVSQVGETTGLNLFSVSQVLHKPISGGTLLLALDQAGVRRESPGGVLVIDDDPRSLTLMAAAVAELGQQPICRRSAKQAVEDLPQLRPRAVVLDLEMPDMDGFAVLDKLRHTKVTAGTPVLIWSVKDLTTEEQQRLGSACSVLRKGDGGMEGLLTHLRTLL